MADKSYENGYSLVELIAVLVIAGVLVTVIAGRFSSSATQQLQASRDAVVVALFAAQQRAMAQTRDVQVVTGGGQIDIQQFNGSTYRSISVGNVQYPLVLPANQTISNHTLDFDRLGRTTETDVNLELNGSVVTISISASGFSQ